MNQVWLLFVLNIPGHPSPEQRLQYWRHLPTFHEALSSTAKFQIQHLAPRKIPKEPQWVKDEIVIGYAANHTQSIVSSLQARGYKMIMNNAKLRFAVYKIPKGKTVNQAISEIQHLNLSGVRYVTRNYIAYALGFRQIWSANRKDMDVPADALVDIQYNLHMIKVPQAWRLSKGDSTVVVGVLDTGLSYRNAAIPTSEQHCGFFSCGVEGQYIRALEGPKHVKIVGGSDVVHGDDFPDAETAHGTHVSTTIAQQAHEFYLAAQNGYVAGGVAGIAPEVTVMPIKVLDYDGSGTYADIATGIQLAADSGADILNMSLGGPTDDPTLASAIQYAYNKGVLLVAACGNESATNCSFPAAYPEVMAVSSIDYGYNLASYSNSGPEVEITAPGGDYDPNTGNSEDLNGDGWGDWIYNIAFKESQDFLGNPINYPETLALYGYAGTSMASPHVAAVAALVKSINPSLPAETIRTLLQQTAVDVGPAGRDNQFGYGLLNAWAACSTAAARRADPLPVLDSILVDRSSTPWGVTWFRSSGQADTFWVALPPQQPGVLDWFSFYLRLKNYGGSGTIRARLIARSSGVRVDPTYNEADYGIVANGSTSDGYFRVHLDDTLSLNRVLWFALAFSYDGGGTWPDTLGDFFFPVGAPPLWLVYDDYTGLPMNIDGTLYTLRSHPEWYETTVNRFITSGQKGNLNYLPWYTGIMGYPTYDQGIMDLSSLKSPEVVIWWMGADNRNGLSAMAGDTAALAAYLNAGGDLFFTGQDYIRSDYRNITSFSAGTFPYDYLGIVTFTQQTDSCTAVGQAYTTTGIDGGPPQTNDLSYTLYCGGPSATSDSGWPRVYSDAINTNAGMVTSFQNASGNVLAIRSNVVLTATTPSRRWIGLFPLESQTPGAQSDSLIFRFFNWADLPLVTTYISNALITQENASFAPHPLLLLTPVTTRQQGFRLLYRGRISALYDVQVFNVTGRVVLHRKLKPRPNQTLTLPTRNLSRGVYIFRVSQGNSLLFDRKVVIH